ncbi:MAG: amidohydrolase family protein, partial [Deltaproteobacteria bacterium]|nr:amidohydrolase family protein [Deltaproteobacteria bacterium]
MSETVLYTGGVVRAMSESAEHGAREETPAARAEALVTRDGLVAGAGSNEDMRALAGRSARVVNLSGATVLPGFIDTHPHLFHFSLLAYPLVKLFDTACHDDIVARIRTRAATTADGEWICCSPVGEPHYFLRRSWHDLAEGLLPDRHVLDRASRAHPIWLQAWGPTTPNVCVFNSAALRELGLTRASPDRAGNVWIEKDRDGEPTGRLRGSVNTYYSGDAYMDELLCKLPLLDPSVALPATLEGIGDYHRMGVTTIYEGHAMGAAEISAFQAIRQMGQLRMRVLTSLEAETYALPWDRPLTEEQFVANLALAAGMKTVDDDLLRHNGVTLSRGGPCNPGFLRMHQPYKGPYGEPTTGRTFVSQQKERIALDYCADHGLRLNFIGTGYADHDEFLANAEALARRVPIADRKWILQHNYLCTQDHARRYADLGFLITTSMSFSCAKGDLMAERIGPHVWKDLIPLRRLLRAGLTVGCGSDWG